MAGFRYPFDVESTLEPWRSDLGSHYDEVIAHLRDRDRALEDFLTIIDPPGRVEEWAGTSATIPKGWLLCDGSAVSRTVYAQLFQAIGTQYGVGDGSTTFNLPNRKGRVGVGQDTGQTEFTTIGQTGGSKNIVVGAVPAHTHGINLNTGAETGHSHNHDHGLTNHNHGGGTGVHAHNVTGEVGTGNTAHTHVAAAGQVSSVPGVGGFFTGQDGSTNSVGVANTAQGGADATGSSGHTHNTTGNTDNGTGGGSAAGNMPPYIVARYIIRY